MSLGWLRNAADVLTEVTPVASVHSVCTGRGRNRKRGKQIHLDSHSKKKQKNLVSLSCLLALFLFHGCVCDRGGRDETLAVGSPHSAPLTLSSHFPDQRRVINRWHGNTCYPFPTLPLLALALRLFLGPAWIWEYAASHTFALLQHPITSSVTEQFPVWLSCPFINLLLEFSFIHSALSSSHQIVIRVLWRDPRLQFPPHQIGIILGQARHLRSFRQKRWKRWVKMLQLEIIRNRWCSMVHTHTHICIYIPSPYIPPLCIPSLTLRTVHFKLQWECNHVIPTRCAIEDLSQLSRCWDNRSFA